MIKQSQKGMDRSDSAIESLRSISSHELAQHNTSQSLWVAIRGLVYDLTPFLFLHPGGSDVLEFAAGRDITTVFEIYHSLHTQKKLTSYCIGTLEDNELPIFPPPSEFYKTVKTKVQSTLVHQRLDSKYPTTIWLRYGCVYLGVIGSWWMQWWWTTSMWQQWSWAILLGYFCAQIGLHPLHDASHAAATRSPWIWRILGASHDFLNGSSFVVWIYQHLLGHHPYTNIAGADPDISTGDPDVRRIKPSQRWFPHYLRQHWYVPFLYGLLGIKTRLQDITLMYIMGSNDQIRMNPMNLWHTTVFWLGKSFFVFYRLFVPWYFLGYSWVQVLSCFAVADAVSSYWLALTFQANHVVEETIWPLPDPNTKVMQVDWAEMQIATTQDYAHQSTFWTLATGALNYQAVHHLFPQIHQAHYPKIAPVIQDVCKEFGIKYLVKEDFWTAFSSHIGHLKALGLGMDTKKND